MMKSVSWNQARCLPAPCYVPNSNFESGSACSCADGLFGQISWQGSVASGSCKPAPCNVAKSTKRPGTACQCAEGYVGQISWSGAVATGECKLRRDESTYESVPDLVPIGIFGLLVVAGGAVLIYRSK